MSSLEELDVTTIGAMEPKTNVVFIMKSGGQIGVSTPLSPEDIMMLWNTKKLTLKIPTAGDHSYLVVKKRHVSCMHTFLMQK